MLKLILALSIFINLSAHGRVSLTPAYDTRVCPIITDLTVLGPQIYEYKTNYSTYYLNGKEATQTLIQTVLPWVHSFEQAGDLVFKFRDLTLCIGLYNDIKSPNAFAYKTQFLMMGLAMSADLEDIPAVTGKTAIELVMAHEFGHFIQNQYNLTFNYILPMLSIKIKEHQADCLAGMIVSYFQNYNISTLLEASEVIQKLADPHLVGDHGTSPERTEALWYGISKGIEFKTNRRTQVTAWEMIQNCSAKYAPTPQK